MLEEIQREIELACLKAHRTPNSVTLIAVSKNRTLEEIEALYQQGQRHFGENYAIEFAQKREQLRDRCPEIIWHFIGQIQTNKAALIAQADYIHSLSSLKHAHALIAKSTKPLRAFIQVNLSKEEHRGGVSATELPVLVQALRQHEDVRLEGLMAILPLKPEQPPSHWFAILQSLRRPEMPGLSMGMSEDFREAIAYGATWLRIGRALFGS